MTNTRFATVYDGPEPVEYQILGPAEISGILNKQTEMLDISAPVHRAELSKPSERGGSLGIRLLDKFRLV